MPKSRKTSSSVRVARPQQFLIAGSSTMSGKIITDKTYKMPDIEVEKRLAAQRYKNVQASQFNETYRHLEWMRTDLFQYSA